MSFFLNQRTSRSKSVLYLPETIRKRGVALPIQHTFHRKPDGLRRSDEDRELLGPGQSGVQKIARKQQVMLHE
jgi:hypothetical protein